MLVDADYSNTQIVCDVGPGVGSSFRFLLRDFWITPMVTVGYSSPLILALSTGSVNVTGGLVTITGSSFGSRRCAGLSSVMVNVSRLVSESRRPLFSPVAPAGFRDVSDTVRRVSVECDVLRYADVVSLSDSVVVDEGKLDCMLCSAVCVCD